MCFQLQYVCRCYYYYVRVQVNTNGAISFTYLISQFTPDSFPLNDTEEIIAPYWADVDITGTGSIGYRETRNPDLLQRANNDIRRAFSSIKFSSKYLFIATWDHVGYYNSRLDKVNMCMIMHTNTCQFVFAIYVYVYNLMQYIFSVIKVWPSKEESYTWK